MKQIHYIVLIFTVLFTMSSCEDFMDIHKDFIKDGEIIYSPKVDSVSFIAGEHRMLFRCWFYKSPNVRSVDLYWNNNQDSLITSVMPSAGIDSIDILLPNMEEKSYTFNIRTTDMFGHKSLWTTDFGNAYGASYQTTLVDRRINEISMVEKNGIIEGKVTFYSAISLQVRNQVRYEKNDGSVSIVTALPEESEILCPDAKVGSSFETRSFYIPEEEAIDTFATEWVVSSKNFPVVYMYDRSAWKALAVSDETASDGGGMNAVIDGNLGSYWHSRWDGGNVPLPHWLIIDLGKPLNAAKFDLYRRTDNTDSKTVEVYLGDSSDPDGAWTKVGVTEFNANKMEVIPTDKTTKGRYLKLFFPDSNRDPFTNLAEFYMYGGI